MSPSGEIWAGGRKPCARELRPIHCRKIGMLVVAFSLADSACTREFKSPAALPNSENSANASASLEEPSTTSPSSDFPTSSPNADSEPDRPSTAASSTGAASQASSESAPEDTQTTDPTPKCEDGQERPCSETQDGKPITFPTGEPAGSCKRGISVCNNDVWGTCIGAIAPKVQDTCDPGNDDNCNGKPTDHCTCTAGETAPCGTSTGACKPGTMTCNANGTWGDCIGAKGPSPERCDGTNIDEDCNGLADLQDPKCECIDGSIERCSLGGQGDCTLGLKRCSQGRLSQCAPRFPKLTIEQCGTRRDGRETILGPATGDENCDGQTDETNWASPRPTGCSLYMMDKDKDGWGATGDDFANTQDAKRSTWGCFCPTTIPAGWRQGQHITVNKDCGDCVDGGAQVKPERSIEPQKEPSRCLESLSSKTPFDYNCSGREERDPEQRGVFDCGYVEGKGCIATGYWSESVPEACGVEAGSRTQEEHCQNSSGKMCVGIMKVPIPARMRCN